MFFSPEVTSLKTFFQSNSNVSGTKSKIFKSLNKNNKIQSEIQKIINQPLNKEGILERNENFSFKSKSELVIVFSVFEKQK